MQQPPAPALVMNEAEPRLQFPLPGEQTPRFCHVSRKMWHPSVIQAMGWSGSQPQLLAWLQDSSGHLQPLAVGAGLPLMLEGFS